MGFWSDLAHIGTIVAAPFTGGASLALNPVINDLADNGGQAAGDVGSVLGKYAQGSAAGRAEQAKLQQGQDRNAIDLYQTQLKAPSVASSQAVRGALLKNLQDASISGLPARINVPQLSGGLRPSALGADKGAIGGGLYSQAMGTLGNMKPATAPTLTPLPQPSTLDKVAGYGGLSGSLLGAASPLFKAMGQPGMTPPYNGPDYGPSLAQLLGGGGDEEDISNFVG